MAKKKTPWRPKIDKPRFSKDEFWDEAEHNELLGRLFEVPGRDGPITVGDIAAGRGGLNRLAIAVHPLTESEFGILLQAATAQNRPDAVRDMILVLLLHLRVDAPSGVFAAPAGHPGRRFADLTRRIYEAWVAMDKPALEKAVLTSLAEQFYPEDWTNSSGDPETQKKLRDRVRGSISRAMLTLRN